MSLYGTIENFYEYMVKNEGSIENIDKEKIVVQTYLNQKAEIRMNKGSTIVLWKEGNHRFK